MVLRVFGWFSLYGTFLMALHAVLEKTGVSATMREWIMTAGGAGLFILIGYVIKLALRQGRWEREGRCLHCGGDRSGLVLTGPCRECGKPPPL